MKILIVHNFYSVKGGGEDIVFEQEKKAMTGLLGKDNVFTYTVTSESIHPVQVISSVFFSRKHYREVYRLIKVHSIDIVHVHNFFPVLSTSVFKAAKDAGAKLVHTIHNYRWWCVSGDFYREEAGVCINCTRPNDLFSAIRYRCYRRSYFQSAVARLAFWYYKRSGSLQYVDLFFALTGFQQMHLISLGIDHTKLRLKPNMVPLPPTVNSNCKNGYVFVGRLEAAKGIKLLLDTWVQLPKHFVLTVVGSGSLEPKLRSQYQAPNIIFKGACLPGKTRTLLSNARYSIQSSLWYETFGLTIIESMGAGVPVIGFNIGTRPELIKDGETGFITTPDQLLDTIIASHDYPHYEIMSTNAINFAASFDTEKIGLSQCAIYDQLISSE